MKILFVSFLLANVWGRLLNLTDFDNAMAN